MEQPHGHLDAHARINIGGALHSCGVEMVGNANDATIRLQKPSSLRHPHPELPLRYGLLFPPVLSPNLLPERTPILTTALRSTYDPFRGWTIRLFDPLRPVRLSHKALWRDHLDWIRSLDPRHWPHPPLQ